MVAVGHGRRVQALHDAPSFGTPVRVRVRWRKRTWRCSEPSCRRGAWTEEHDFAPPRAELTSRAVERAVSLLRLGVNWHTCWNADKKHAEASIDIKKRASGVKTIGVDEHIWRPTRISSADKAVTVMVDLTRCPDRCLCARLLDAVQGRSGTGYADWLKEQGDEVTVSVGCAALNPFREYRNAIRNTLDEVRRRVQPATLGRCGHKDDPPYRVRRIMLTGIEHLTDRQRARLDKWLPLGDPNSEVEVTWHVYQQVRSVYTATSPAAGRKTTEKVLESLHTCPTPEVAKLGRTLRQWRTEILARFDTGGMLNGGTEALNGVIEKTCRPAHGFRNFTNYRIRILLATDGARPYRRPPTKTRSAERADPG